MVIINYNNGSNTIYIAFKNNEFYRGPGCVSEREKKELMLVPFDSSVDLQVCAVCCVLY